jgi:hypothetical protein
LRLEPQYETPYFFSAKCWRLTGFRVCVLTENFRQADVSFGAVLDQVRSGIITPAALSEFNDATVGKPHRHPDPVRIVMTNAAVKRTNSERLSLLPGREYLYEGHAEGDWSRLPTEEDLYLKVGARVMMLNNDPEKRWVNGSAGYVVQTGPVPCVQLDTGGTHEIEPYTWEQTAYVLDPKEGIVGTVVIGAFTQIPLRLAWAVTAHKTQALTLDDVLIDWGRRAFAFGQAYVALSRVRTLKGLRQVRALRDADIMIDPVIERAMREFTDGSTHGNDLQQSELNLSPLAEVRTTQIDAQALLDKCRDAGITIYTEDGVRYLTGPTHTEALARELIARKSEILPLLEAHS